MMNTENKAMIKDGKEVCPCCDRHCPVDNLHCPNGKEHFGLPVEENEGHMTEADLTLSLLRKCGHFLHHNVGHGEVDSSKMFASLKDEEQKQLNVLLKKCLKGWEGDQCR